MVVNTLAFYRCGPDFVTGIALWGRTVVAHPRPVIFPEFSAFLHHTRTSLYSMSFLCNCTYTVLAEKRREETLTTLIYNMRICTLEPAWRGIYVAPLPAQA